MNLIEKNTEIHNRIDYREGRVILIDKAKEWTSFDVVNKIRYRLRKYHDVKKIKVGHNGTLDPLATGLLMIFTGKYTKRIPEEENHDKTYIAHVKLGATTPSLDRETDEEQITNIENLGRQDIIEACKSFLGTREQEIPFYSASKQKGMPMYKRIREGLPIERKFKTVQFHAIELLEFGSPICKIRIVCGKGTYIRTFARDLGQKLGITAYLYDLERSDIAEYNISRALSVEEFCNKIEGLEYKH